MINCKRYNLTNISMNQIDIAVTIDGMPLIGSHVMCSKLMISVNHCMEKVNWLRFVFVSSMIRCPSKCYNRINIHIQNKIRDVSLDRNMIDVHDCIKSKTKSDSLICYTSTKTSIWNNNSSLWQCWSYDSSQCLSSRRCIQICFTYGIHILSIRSCLNQFPNIISNLRSSWFSGSYHITIGIASLEPRYEHFGLGCLAATHHAFQNNIHHKGKYYD